ncbi:glycosyltransferase family protein [Candidatus Manganitrophus noduliformans]|uniref:Glycosyltransferase n=1 Tax=Candidatus Manganitrophus noduliformans TaxID=2606439 RepID=A0A7X6IDI7_9BACT|nr:glycosyltransferase [Candidatus Manganitrophus noduliformans]NKE73748.1 glycosyltransferase [Candidatus Manganitrophus noduliformans]
MKKLMVYSHDTFGLGNIRRMLSICQHLISSTPDLCILLISGSPMIQSFRLPPRLDYVKLPCLSRTEREGYSVKSLGTGLEEMMALRSDLILTAAANFKPDLFLVDKKPYGVKGELEEVFKYLELHSPETKNVLLLRDILDRPEATIPIWEKNGYYDAIRSFYDLVLLVGLPEIFDPRKEYRFPAEIAEKVRFCGYIRREAGSKRRDEIREELGLNGEQLVLVTPGGGEDGYRLLETYIMGLEQISGGDRHRSLIVCGPEMPKVQRERLQQKMAQYPHVGMAEFTNDLMSYMDAADVVVSMGGYNTVCEILSLRKRAVVVPRAKPVEEQWIRAERFSRLGLFKTVHPDDLTPQTLMRALLDELGREARHAPPPPQIDLNALPRITEWISILLAESEKASNQVSGDGEDWAVDFFKELPDRLEALPAEGRL